MADKSTPPAREKADPTIKSGGSAPEYPEGTHPVRTASEVTHSATNIEYSENPDKPDPSTVAQVQEINEDFPNQGEKS